MIRPLSAIALLALLSTPITYVRAGTHNRSKIDEKASNSSSRATAEVEFLCGEGKKDEFYLKLKKRKKPAKYVIRNCRWLSKQKKKLKKKICEQTDKSPDGVHPAYKVCPTLCDFPCLPDCTLRGGPELIRDGWCHDFPPFNTEECGWDGGDCLTQEYPDCIGSNPSLLGDGECYDRAPENTEECGWDGGDCLSQDYPDCKGGDPSLIGDALCDNRAPYNSEECGWDGGDCLTQYYPDCKGGDPRWLRDGNCYNQAPYNTKECGWDGGDCLSQDYPDCKGVDPSWLGNGFCTDYPPYNTAECEYDGGDCPAPP